MWGFPSTFLGMRSDVATDAPGFSSVQTRLGPVDLTTVDALISASIASSRAEAIRWAIARTREDPASAALMARYWLGRGQAPKRPTTQRSETFSDLGLYVGADDGNRTRTVSLGS